MEFNPFSADFFDDPYDTYRWLRDEAPAYHNERYGFWALSRYADVLAAHRDFRTFSSAHGLTIEQLRDPDFQDGGMMIFMDPPKHTRLRKLVSDQFTPRAISTLEPMVRAVITSYLDPLMDRPSFDVIADFAALFPVEVISALLGVPPDDRQQIRLWADEILHREPDDPHTTQAGLEAGLHSVVYFLELVRAKRAAPGDDLIGRLIETEVTDETGTHRLADDEIAAFAALLATAGSETVTKLLGSAVVLFDRNPGEWRKVLDDVERIPRAVEEVVRYWAPSQYQGRFSHAPSDWHGVTIPEGTPVLLVTGAAGRDERQYPDPDRFDIDREPGITVGFGHGAHHCIGAALARLESRVAIEEIRARWPVFEVDHDGLRRVQMANVAGFSHVPVAVRAA